MLERLGAALIALGHRSEKGLLEERPDGLLSEVSRFQPADHFVTSV
jgi:hypothetical protein